MSRAFGKCQGNIYRGFSLLLLSAIEQEYILPIKRIIRFLGINCYLYFIYIKLNKAVLYDIK